MGTGISFHQQTVEVLSATVSADKYGNQSSGWSNPTARTVTGCRVVPAQNDEVLDRQTTRWTLFAPPDTALNANDRVRWDGVIYGVDGEVRRWASPSGALAHIEADLQRVKG